MDNPMISVIVPVYKAEPYLRKCLDSIVNQTYRNLEIILVDDGSPDDSGAICDEYAKIDDRIIVIHKENGGVALARNAGLDVAVGEWIGFVDSDDWIEPDMYEYLLQLAQKNDADVAQCGVFFEESTNTTELFCLEKEIFTPYGADKFSSADWKLVSNPTCNKIYRANIVNNTRYNPAYPIGEDLLFNLQTMRMVKGVAWGTQAKYHYIQHNNSVCHSVPNICHLRSYHEMLREAKHMFEGNNPALAFIEAEQARNSLDICSKIVRFPSNEFTALKTEICAELRSNVVEIMRLCTLGLKDKTKILLAVYWWRVYRFLLLKSKKMRG